MAGADSLPTPACQRVLVGRARRPERGLDVGRCRLDLIDRRLDRNELGSEARLIAEPGQCGLERLDRRQQTADWRAKELTSRRAEGLSGRLHVGEGRRHATYADVGELEIGERRHGGTETRPIGTDGIRAGGSGRGRRRRWDRCGRCAWGRRGGGPASGESERQTERCAKEAKAIGHRSFLL